MRKFLLISTVSLMLPAAAMAQVPQNGASDAENPLVAPNAGGAMMGSPMQLSAQDQSFIKKAATSGMAEVQEGQIAQTKGDSAVQTIGARMVADHTKANDQLRQIAQLLHAPLPATLSAKQTAMISQLQSASGTSAFDSTYLAGQKTAHLKAIKIFEQEISEGSNPQLKNFAATTLPVLKMHLAMVESAEK